MTASSAGKLLGLRRLADVGGVNHGLSYRSAAAADDRDE